MNKTLLKLFVGAVALSLAGCAAFFSIVGLSKLFAGAATAVIVMASTLEASKLVIASFLYQFWKTTSKALRSYLLVAISIIAIITSIGIYGFLSGAYQETKSKYDLTQTQTDSLTVKKTYYESSVVTFKGQLTAKTTQLTNLTNIRNSQEIRATELVNKNRSSRSADRSAKETDASIKQINVDIDDLNKKIISYSDSASKIQVAITQLSLKNEISSELGSLAYISRTLNVSMDKVVNILIILFIIVFDPLAICMVLAFNFMNDKKLKKEPSKEPIEDTKDPFIIHDTPKEPVFTPSNEDSFNFLFKSEDELPENTTVQPSEQPREQSVQEQPNPKPKLSQIELKELQKESIRKKAEQDRLQKLKKDIYDESQTKTY
jgi:hypothetical protein